MNAPARVPMDVYMEQQMRVLAEEFYIARVLSPLVEASGYLLHELHEALLGHLYGYKHIAKDGVIVMVPARTCTDMTNAEFSEFLRKAQQIGSWLDVPMTPLHQFARDVAHPVTGASP